MDRIRRLIDFVRRVYPYVQNVWKAATAFYGSAVAQYVLARQTDGVSIEEWGFLLGTSLLVGLGVYFKRNVQLPGSG